MQGPYIPHTVPLPALRVRMNCVGWASETGISICRIRFVGFRVEGMWLYGFTALRVDGLRVRFLLLESFRA